MPDSNLPSFYECGICGQYHPAEWDGDCRDDGNRFLLEDIEEKYGEEFVGWQEVEMPEFGEPKIGKGFYF